MPRPRVTFSRNGSTSSGPSGPAEGHQQERVVRRGRVAHRQILASPFPAAPPSARSRTVPAVLRPYRELLATPGGLRFSSAAFVARMPIAMIGLGIVLLVVAETGRYGRAGALSATFALVNAGAAPAIARLVDRLGQRRVLLPAVPLHLRRAGRLRRWSPAATHRRGRWWSTIVVAALLGAVDRLAGAGPLGLRARRATRGSARPTRFESVLDELIFVLGPLIVTLLATLVAPQAGAAHGAASCSRPGRRLLVSHRASEPPPSPHGERPPVGAAQRRACRR